MSEVVKLVPTERNEALVAELEHLLDRAKDGNIVGLVGVTLRPDQTFGVIRVGDCSDLELAGALSFAQYDLMASNKADETHR